MSELKAINCVDSDVQEFCEPRLVYLKEDVDAVITRLKQKLQDQCISCPVKMQEDDVVADLEERHKKEVEQLLIEIAKIKDIDKKNRSAYYKDLAMMAKDVERQKYKRCLDKANYWVAISYHCVDDKHKHKAEKRHYKWLKLAEQFKEGV